MPNYIKIGAKGGLGALVGAAVMGLQETDLANLSPNGVPNCRQGRERMLFWTNRRSLRAIHGLYRTWSSSPGQGFVRIGAILALPHLAVLSDGHRTLAIHP